jgi:hypothetical protein
MSHAINNDMAGGDEGFGLAIQNPRLYAHGPRKHVFPLRTSRGSLAKKFHRLHRQVDVEGGAMVEDM